MGETTVKLGWIRTEVDVKEPVWLLGRDVVEALQGLHGVGRADLLEEGLQLLLGPQAADAIELCLGAYYSGHRRQLLSTQPQRDVLVPAAAHERIQDVFALVVEDRRVV